MYDQSGKRRPSSSWTQRPRPCIYVPQNPFPSHCHHSHVLGDGIWLFCPMEDIHHLPAHQPRAAAGAIPCIYGQSLSRGTSKRSPQAPKALSIIVRSAVYTGVIDVCIIGLVYTEDFQISFDALPLSLEALAPRRSSAEGKSPLPAPQLARLGSEGQSL